jgi:hypothetical protein
MEDLKISHDAGFFSCSSVALDKIIEFHNKRNFLPTLDRKSQYSWYKDHLNQGVDNFFEEKKIDIYLKPENLKEDSEMESQFSDYSLLNYEYLKKIINTYFYPCEQVREIENYLIKKYQLNLSKTISVCFRGNDKRTETTLPTYIEILNKINQVKEINPDHTVLVQSDEYGFIEFIRENIKDFIEVKETKKISNRNTAVQFTVDIGERLINAQIFLAVMQIISKSDKVIINSGNVGIWTCFYRGNANGVYQFLSNGLQSNEKTRNQKIGWVK